MTNRADIFEGFFNRLRRRRIVKVVFGMFKWLVLGILLLCIALWFLLQNEKVQNWALQKVTTYLSKELETRVEAKRIDIDFFNKLVLEGFYVEDHKGDTLLYSERLKASLSTDLISIIQKRLDINSIYLENAQINMVRDTGEYKSNVEVLLDRLRGEEDTTQTKPFFLDIDALYLSQIQFVKDDRVSGQLLKVELVGGEILVNEFNLQDKLIDIRDAHLDVPLVELIERTKNPLPEEEEDTEENETDSDAEDEKVYVLQVQHFELDKGTFALHNLRSAPIKTTPDDELDYKHLEVLDISINIDTFQFTENIYTGQVNLIRAHTSSGFVLNELSAEAATVSGRKLELLGMKLITPNSSLKESLIFKYRQFSDFDEFPDRVLMIGDFKQSKVALGDIMVFAKNLKNNAFFRNNEETVFEIDGKIQGRVNSLRGKDLTIKLGESTTFKGSFSSKNLSVRNEEFLSLNLDEMNTDMQTLRLLVPGFDPPSNFDKLGKLNFKGNFDGFFIDFVADGILQSDLGRAEMDMRMDLRQGRELAEYSGGLSLINFDLGKWSGNTDLGKITLKTKVEDGEGLTIQTVNARLGGKIDHFTFKDYTYENIELDAALNQHFFDGKLNIKDDNIDLAFDGSIDFVDSIPKFDFDVKVNQLALQKLNLIKEDIVLAGDVDLNLIDQNISNVQGDVLIRNLKMKRNQTELYELDSLVVHSILLPDAKRHLTIDSDLLNGNVDGYYDLQQIGNAVLMFVERNYPELSERFKIKSTNQMVGKNQFDFALSINDSKNFTNLIDTRLDTLREIEISGYFDNVIDSILLDVEVPYLNYDNVELVDILLDLDGQGNESKLEFEVYHTNWKGQLFEPISLNGAIEQDTFFFELVSTNFTSIFDDLNLNGQIFLVPDENYQVSFFPSNLVILKQEWSIDEDNFLRFGKNFIETNNFDLRNNEKRIVLRSLKERGLALGLENITLALIDDWWDYDKMDFSGLIDIELTAKDIFKLEGLNLSAHADTFDVNGDDWGILRIDANLEDLTKPTDVYLSITDTKGTEQLTVEGIIAPFKKNGRVFEDEFDLNVNISNYPLDIAEYFIDNIISNTIGRFDSNVKLNGKLKQPNINGTIRIYDSALTINYLKTRYRIDESISQVSNTLFDVTGTTLIDSLGNKAYIAGGIGHNHLKDFYLAANITTDEFLFLNTKKTDNELYYGTAIGKGSVRFNGPFSQIDVDIEATTGKGTKIIIPISYGEEINEVKFIEYIEDEDASGVEVDTRKLTELRGVQVNMQVDMTQDAEVLLVFDERSGDIIKGTGEGQIQFSVSRLGEIAMYGTYQIMKGDYLFTLLNVVNKPFSVKEGGTIKWGGDPFNAIIDIEAEYKGLSTSLSNFIAEYITQGGDGSVKDEARKAYNVDLTMFLDGPLLQPNINFDINFPGLDGELRNYTESKLRIIRQDQGELNRQVFGLLVIGGFLPSGNSNAFAGRGGLIPINTLSEFVSSQLSIYLTELLSEVFTDVGFISGVDFNINYNVYQADEVAGAGVEAGVKTGSELQLNLNNSLFNDRLSVNLGGNIDWGGNANSNGAFLAGDVVIEYVLTKDRRFKVRFYQLTDSTLEGGRRNKRGLGFSYRREFDNFSEFIHGMKQTAKKTIE